MGREFELNSYPQIRKESIKILAHGFNHWLRICLTIKKRFIGLYIETVETVNEFFGDYDPRMNPWAGWQNEIGIPCE